MTDTPAERGPENPWERLRRRKLVQWTIAYAAGAWALAQVLALAADTYGWPPIINQLAMLGLALGLPVVVTLAWFHGERSQQRVTGRELAILTALLLVGGALLWWYADRRAPAPTSVASTSTAPASATTDPRPSIAVLPFDNRSRLEDDAYFVDGIHDDILTQLSKISALKVISRTSVEQFRDSKLPLKDIAAQLGVKSILEGGVQRAGDRVRVTVQLIDANSDAHLWAENYDRDLTAANIFAIQSELAGEIAGALKASLSPAEQVRVAAIPTKSLKAWEAYQLGQQRYAQRTSASLEHAERYFRSAISLDPKFALAYSGLADAIEAQTTYSGRASKEGLDKAEQAARQAVQLQPDLAEGWASLGSIATSRGELAKAERLLRQAVDLNPNLAAAQMGLSEALRLLGRRQESLEHGMRALQLEPLSASINNSVGYALDEMGRPEDAAERYRRAIEIDPHSPTTYLHLGFLQAYTWNRFPEAVPLIERAIELDSGDPSLVGVLAFVLLDMNEEVRSAEAMQRATRDAPNAVDTNIYAAWYYSTLGDHAAAELAARKVLETYPRDFWSLAVTRNADLREGDPGAARARYASAYPQFLVQRKPQVDSGNVFAAIDFAYLLKRIDENGRASALLDESERAIRQMPRMGSFGFAYADIQIHTLRGNKKAALAALREAADAGWRSWWRYFRDFDPILDPIRNEPEFKAVFADIERDMAKQRAALAARPKDAPLDLAATGT